MPDLFYFDRYHQEDLLFAEALARELARRPVGGRGLGVVFGAGERVERMLEGQGHFPERRDGVLAVDAAARPLLERAMREATRELAGVLTEAQVPATPIVGADRGMVRLMADGDVEIGGARMLEALFGQGVVPVISAIGQNSEGEAIEVAPGALLAALARALGDVRVLIAARSGAAQVVQSQGDGVSGGALPGEPDTMAALRRAGVPVRVGGASAGLFDAAG